MPAKIMRMVPAVRRFGRQLTKRGSALAAAYQAAIETDPVRTKALTSFVGLVIADCIAQAGEGGCYDPMRTTRMGLFGLAIHGPMGHYWYELLDRKVMPNAGNSSAAVVAKMTADQAVFAPASTMIFYTALAAMNGHLADLPAILEAKLVSTVLAGYALWPLAHLINFKFVPSHQRMLYINAVNLVWTVFLSRMANAPSAGALDVCPDPSSPAAQAYTSIPVSTAGVDAMPRSHWEV